LVLVLDGERGRAGREAHGLRAAIAQLISQCQSVTGRIGDGARQGAAAASSTDVADTSRSVGTRGGGGRMASIWSM